MKQWCWQQRFSYPPKTNLVKLVTILFCFLLGRLGLGCVPFTDSSKSHQLIFMLLLQCLIHSLSTSSNNGQGNSSRVGSRRPCS